MHSRDRNTSRGHEPSTEPAVGAKMPKGFCPTCAAIQAVLTAARVPPAAARATAYSPAGRRADKAIRSGVRKVATSAAAKKTRAAMSKHLRTANGKARKKNGDFKKGWNQARVMKEAHRLCRKKR